MPVPWYDPECEIDKDLPPVLYRSSELLYENLKTEVVGPQLTREQDHNDLR